MAHRRFPIRLNILSGCSCDLQVSDGDPGVGKVSGSPAAMMRSLLPVVEVQSETPLAAQTRETEESEQVEKPGAIEGNCSDGVGSLVELAAQDRRAESVMRRLLSPSSDRPASLHSDPPAAANHNTDASATGCKDGGVVMPCLLELVSSPPNPPSLGGSAPEEASPSWVPEGVAPEVAERVAQVLMGKYRSLADHDTTENSPVQEPTQDGAPVWTPVAGIPAEAEAEIAPAPASRHETEDTTRLAQLLEIQANGVPDTPHPTVPIRILDPQWCAQIDSHCASSLERASASLDGTSPSVGELATQLNAEEPVYGKTQTHRVENVEEVSDSPLEPSSSICHFYDTDLLDLVEVRPLLNHG